MTKQHLTPCKQCPWRRESAPGYLGNSTPGDFWWAAERGDRMECHCVVDYDADDCDEQIAKAPQCAGAAIFFANQKRARDSRHLQLPIDHKEVFSSAKEFLDHHNRIIKTEIEDQEAK